MKIYQTLKIIFKIKELKNQIIKNFTKILKNKPKCAFWAKIIHYNTNKNKKMLNIQKSPYNKKLIRKNKNLIKIILVKV